MLVDFITTPVKCEAGLFEGPPEIRRTFFTKSGYLPYLVLLRARRAAERAGFAGKHILAAANLTTVVYTSNRLLAFPASGVEQPFALRTPVACLDDFI